MEIIFEVFYKLHMGTGWTLAVVLVMGTGTVFLGLFALDIARQRIVQDFPDLDPDQVKLEILGGNQN